MKTWFVFCENINRREIEQYNIFEHGGFSNEFKRLKKWKLSKEEFAEELKHICMYYYWSKCEWEIILSDWPPSDNFKKEKVDVYDQLTLNWDVFVDYCYYD